MPALLRSFTSTSPVFEEVSPPPRSVRTDVRIQVAAAAVNPVDVIVLTGPLREVAGLPDPVGLDWTSATASRMVATLSPVWRRATVSPASSTSISLKPSVGTHADETVLPAEAVAPIPDGLDVVEAASIPLNALTARQALDLLGPADGRTLLITGGAGAVGGHAIVLAAPVGG